MFTHQFKRGVYETFLQEYHFKTQDGLNPKFDMIRNFARYDIGDINLFYIQHKGMIVQPSGATPYLAFSDELIESINNYGFYTMHLFGFWFYLEVTPKSESTREAFLAEEIKRANMPNPIMHSINRLDYITDLDFTLKQLSYL